MRSRARPTFIAANSARRNGRESVRPDLFRPSTFLLWHLKTVEAGVTLQESASALRREKPRRRTGFEPELAATRSGERGEGLAVTLPIVAHCVAEAVVASFDLPQPQQTMSQIEPARTVLRGQD